MERIFIGIKVPRALTAPISHLYTSRLSDRRYQRNCRWVEDELHHITLTFIGGVTTEKREAIQRALREVQFSSFSLKLHSEIETFPHGAKRKPSVLHLPVYSSGSNNQYSIELENLKNSIDKIVTISDVCPPPPSENSSLQVAEVSPFPMSNPIKHSEIEHRDPVSMMLEDSTPAKISEEEVRRRRPKRNHEKYHPHLTLSRVKQNANGNEIPQIIEELNDALKNTAEIVWNEMNFDVTQFVLFRSSLTKDGAVYEVIEEYNCI